MNLTIDNITKKYKDKVALNQFSTTLTDGVYGFVGPNGSGKSTLMKILANVLHPTSGKVMVDGQDISVMDEQYRDLLGYLPQHFGVYKSFSAERFLLYIAALKGLDKTFAKQKVDEVLHLVNLEKDRKRKVHSFSGGMRQRIGIAQALLNDPKILIVDEPTAGLDPKERVRFRNLLSEISGERIIILSTHIVSDIAFIAKEVMLIENGQLLKQDTQQNLLRALEGSVWSVLIQEHELASLKTKGKLGNIARVADGIEVRMVSNEKPSESATLQAPTLEDLYLHYFSEDDAAWNY